MLPPIPSSTLGICLLASPWEAKMMALTSHFLLVGLIAGISFFFFPLALGVKGGAMGKGRQMCGEVRLTD